MATPRTGLHTGVVSTWDEAGGYGTLRGDDGTEVLVHCTAIADGSRTTAAGARVAYRVAPGHLGRWEAAEVATTG